MADRWNFEGKGSVGNSTYIWLPMYRESTTGKFKINGLDGSGNADLLYMYSSISLNLTSMILQHDLC